MTIKITRNQRTTTLFVLLRPVERIYLCLFLRLMRDFSDRTKNHYRKYLQKKEFRQRDNLPEQEVT